MGGYYTYLVPNVLYYRYIKVVVGGILKASAGPSWRPMTRLGGERPGISTALPVSGSDCLLRLSTSYEVRMACVPPAETESSRDSMHSLWSA